MSTSSTWLTSLWPVVERRGFFPFVFVPNLSGIRINPGDNWQAKIDANPNGTAFVIGSGTHREQSAVPKNGMTFIGESDSVIVSGARNISSGVVPWIVAGDHWYTGGQTQQGYAHPGAITLTGYAADNLPEEVFVNGTTRLRRMGTLAAAGPNQWYFDYAADRIYIGSNPVSFTSIETSVTSFLLAGTTVEDVVISNLFVEKYTSPAQGGAIGGYVQGPQPNPGYDWTIDHCDVGYNHGGGIRIGPGFTITNSRIHHNGQIGLAGYCTHFSGALGGSAPLYQARVRVQDTEVDHNCEIGYDPGWEGGGTKFQTCYAGLDTINLWVHHNIGFALWTDWGNYDWMCRSNLVEDNGTSGIFDEVNPAVGQAYATGTSRQIIKWNQCYRNGIGSVNHNKLTVLAPGDYGFGIDVSNSRAAEVFENLLINNKWGLFARDDAREEQLWDYNGHHNKVDVNGSNGNMQYIRAPGGRNNVANNNSYYDTSAPAGSRWNIGAGLISWAAWQAAGYDAAGSLVAGTPTFDFAGATPFSLSTYGPV